MAGHTTGTWSRSGVVDRANHAISELTCETGSPHSTLFLTPPLPSLTASAVGAAQPPSCLLGTGGGLLRGGPGGLASPRRP